MAVLTGDHHRVSAVTGGVIPVTVLTGDHYRVSAVNGGVILVTGDCLDWRSP